MSSTAKELRFGRKYHQHICHIVRCMVIHIICSVTICPHSLGLFHFFFKGTVSVPASETNQPDFLENKQSKAYKLEAVTVCIYVQYVWVEIHLPLVPNLRHKLNTSIEPSQPTLCPQFVYQGLSIRAIHQNSLKKSCPTFSSKGYGNPDHMVAYTIHIIKSHVAHPNMVMLLAQVLKEIFTTRMSHCQMYGGIYIIWWVYTIHKIKHSNLT